MSLVRAGSLGGPATTMAASAADSTAAWPTTPGFEALVRLMQRPASEQVPASLPRNLWEALFNGLAGDDGFTEEEWAKFLRTTYEETAVAHFTKYDLLKEYQEARETELPYLKMKFGNSECCSCPLGNVKDKSVLFERLCLIWFSLEDRAGEDVVIGALRNAILHPPPRKDLKRKREESVTLSADDAEFVAKWLKEDHAERAIERDGVDARSHWIRVGHISSILTQGAHRCTCEKCSN